MNFLQQRRSELGLTQKQLAQLCSLARQRVCEIENGLLLPTQAVAHKLENALALEAIPSSEEILKLKRLKNLIKLRPFELPQQNLENWKRMQQRWPHLMQRLKAPQKVLAWLKWVPLKDSGTESLALVELAAEGATPAWANPHSCGFRRQPIVDSKGYALGERHLPCLHWKRPHFECILWPQVTVRPGLNSYRLDFLVLLRTGRHTIWLVVEIDGPHHAGQYDNFRAQEIGLDQIRVTSAQVKQLLFARTLMAEFEVIATTGRPSQPTQAGHRPSGTRA